MAMRFNRRSFLKQTALAAGLAAGASLSRGPILLAAGSPASKPRTVVIGCGGRGTSSHLPPAARENLVAICDVDEKNWGKAMKFLEDKAKDVKVGSVKTYFDYRKMFDEMHKDIDAVFVATPNHHHAPPAMIAMKLGKAVYVEKPVSHTLNETLRMAAASRQYKVATQMGNQGHCGEGYRRLCEYIWAGAIGNVVETHSWTNRSNGGAGPRPDKLDVPAGLHWDEWIGPAPFRDYHKGLHAHDWHNWWDFGNGSLGNMAAHVLDGPVWSLKLKAPTAVELEEVAGGGDGWWPTTARIRWDFAARGTMAPVKVYWYEGKKLGVKDAGASEEEVGAVGKKGINWPPMAVDLQKKYDFKMEESGTIYIGDKGVMYTGCYGGGVTILPREKMKEFPVPEKTLPRVTGGPFGNFLDAVRAGKTETASDFTTAVDLMSVMHLGNIAQRAGLKKKVLWDGTKVTNMPELNKLLSTTPRKGWEV